MRETQTVLSNGARSGKVAPQNWRTADMVERPVTVRKVKPAPRNLTREQKIRNMRSFA